MIEPNIYVWSQSLLVLFFLCYCRIQSCLLIIPVFSERFLSVRVKISFAIALTPLFSFGLPGVAVSETLFEFGVIVFTEIIFGLLIGGVVRLIFISLDMAATTIAMTASLSQIVGVPNEFSPHPIGSLMHLLGLGLLMALGFPFVFCDLIRESFVLKPIGTFPTMDGVLSAGVGLVAKSFFLAMLLASPFILGGFLFQALSGVVSKVMPSLPIVFIAAPAAILLALLGLSIFTPTILAVWVDAVLSTNLQVLR